MSCEWESVLEWRQKVIQSLYTPFVGLVSGNVLDGHEELVDEEAIHGQRDDCREEEKRHEMRMEGDGPLRNHLRRKI